MLAWQEASSCRPAVKRAALPAHEQVRLQKKGMEALMAGLVASTPGTPVTEQDMSWALQAVRSRAFSGPYAGAIRKSCTVNRDP